MAKSRSGHDGLARTRVVGEQVAQRLARNHLAVDRGDLMGERVYERGVDGQQRVEEVCEADAASFGNHTEQAPVAIEAPGQADGDYLQLGFAVAVQQLAAKLAG